MKYTCSKCDYQASRQEHMQIHFDSIHVGLRYPCDQCDYKATAKTNLKGHIRKKHFDNLQEGLHPWPCSQCEYEAAEKPILRVISGGNINEDVLVEQMKRLADNVLCKYCILIQRSGNKFFNSQNSH